MCQPVITMVLAVLHHGCTVRTYHVWIDVSTMPKTFINRDCDVSDPLSPYHYFCTCIFVLFALSPELPLHIICRAWLILSQADNVSRDFINTPISSLIRATLECQTEKLPPSYQGCEHRSFAHALKCKLLVYRLV